MSFTICVVDVDFKLPLKTVLKVLSVYFSMVIIYRLTQFSIVVPQFFSMFFAFYVINVLLDFTFITSIIVVKFFPVLLAFFIVRFYPFHSILIVPNMLAMLFSFFVLNFLIK